MNPRIEKLKAERDRLCEKDMAYQARIKQLDEQIMKLENTDIVGIVRENGLTIDELSELLELLDKQPNAPLPEKFMNMEDDNEER
jgi:hypothetical protein